MGIHWRVEMDAVRYGMVNVEQHKIDFQEQITQVESKTIYLATGDQKEECNFKERYNAKGFNVLSKWDLAEAYDQTVKVKIAGPSMVEQLKQMPFDIVAIIDYLLLLRGQIFLGVGLSSFSGHIFLNEK